MNTQVKIQVPIDKTIRDGLEKRATALGFDSIQAYIRVWAKAEVDGRELNFGDDWGQASDEAAARINKSAEDAKNGIDVSEPFETVEDFMNGLKCDDEKVDTP